LKKTKNTLEIEDKIKSMQKMQKWQTIILPLLIVLILIILCIFVEQFATFGNIINLLVQVSPIGIMACGVTIVMITGGIDISAPAVMATAAVIGADYIARTGNLVFGSVLMLLVGALMGAINGFAVAFLRMVPLVVTLAMMTINMGIAIWWTMGESIVGLPLNFSLIFNEFTIIGMYIVVAGIFSFILRKTVFGRWLYYIGNNVNTARISGIPTAFVIFMTYIISGLCAGIVGIINTSILSSARPGMGPETQILDIVSAVVIGGVSVNGGVGTIEGAVIGSVFIIMINNIMNLIGVPYYYAGFMKGIIIILAVAIDTFKTKFIRG